MINPSKRCINYLFKNTFSQDIDLDGTISQSREDNSITHLCREILEFNQVGQEYSTDNTNNAEFNIFQH